MSFELTVATKRDPLEGRASGELRPKAVCTTVLLNGLLSESASAAVVDIIRDAHAQGATSIVLEIQDVRFEDDAVLEQIAELLMDARSSGVEVQALVRDRDLHQKFSSLPDSRDWLRSIKAADPTTPRKALHVDPPRPSGTAT